MDELTAGELAGLCKGTLISGDPGGKVLGVSINSRAIEKAEAFFAIKGERFDGHDFASAALEQGAACIVGLPEKLDGLVGAAAGTRLGRAAAA